MLEFDLGTRAPEPRFNGLTHMKYLSTRALLALCGAVSACSSATPSPSDESPAGEASSSANAGASSPVANSSTQVDASNSTGTSNPNASSQASSSVSPNASGAATLPSGVASSAGPSPSNSVDPALPPTAGPVDAEPINLTSAVRKVKGVLTGLAPTDAELVTAASAGGLATLIDGWMSTPQFEDKMVFFFQNAFQQSSLAQLDFEFQLRKRPGAFDLSYNIFGDNAFPLLFKNMKESFARTCLQLVAEGRPFSEVLTTDRFMLTTALKSLYRQIEMPYDIHTMSFKFNHGERPPLSETLDPNSPNFMVFGYEAAQTSTADRVFSSGTCAGDASQVSEWPGNTLLFQILLGSVPRDSSNNSLGLTLLGCMEHPTKPYFEPSDFEDWQMVQVVPSGTTLASYDLPGLRASGDTLHTKLPRVSFFTTPAFLAVWNTNDSNQHRVTANQALLAALGMGFTAADANIPSPPDLAAVDGEHAVSGSECYGCHKSLDPMRQYFGSVYDFNDQPDGKKSSGKASFGFGDVTGTDTSLGAFGGYLSQITDGTDQLNRFALEMTQKLCFFANSSRCVPSDPEMRRIAKAFVDANYDFHTLVRELFSSSLITNLSATATTDTDGVTISIVRRNQLCQALSARLAIPDLCEIEMPTPTNVTSAVNRLAGSLPADAFSRGSEVPITAPDPNLFYRAAAELLCESIAAKVVDQGASPAFASASADAAIEALVNDVMALAPSDPLHVRAVEILQAHFASAQAEGATATNALRSTFAAACLSPSSLAFGL